MKPIKEQTLTTHQALITDLSSEGLGVTNLDGKATFIRGALPGEQVTFTINKKRSRLNLGQLISFDAPHAQRRKPRCPHFGLCGGCALQHLSTQGQIEFKMALLSKQLSHFGKVVAGNVLEPLSGPSYGYRRKARLGVKYVIKKDRVLIGFREINGQKLADMSECHTLEPRAADLIEPFSAYLKGLKCRAQIAQIEVALGDSSQAWVIRHLAPLGEDEARLIEFAKAHNLELYLQPNKLNSIHKVWPETVSERLHYEIKAFNLHFAFHPIDFIQVNKVINEKMIAQAMQLLNVVKGERILDLFCGLGNFSLPMARLGAEVVGIEGQSLMVERAYENAKANQLENVKFYSFDLTQSIKGQPWLEKPFDAIVIDPPRSGALEVLDTISLINPSKILYISCNPATLARDAGVLVHTHGYRLSDVGIMDMFPQTHHAEAMALFIKA